MKLSSTAIALSAVLALAGCDNSAVISPEQQMGPDPVLPAAQDFLMPPMQVPKGVGWQQNQMPKVAEGLKIDKVADGLLHPRQLLTLPNGDVLVVEANGPGTEAVSTPKQLIAGLVKGQSGKGGKGGNRITLLRPTADGRWEKHVFLEGLDSPFGVQLIGNTLYVANTGNIMQYAYQPGETRISDAGKELADLPDTIHRLGAVDAGHPIPLIDKIGGDRRTIAAAEIQQPGIGRGQLQKAVEPRPFKQRGGPEAFPGGSMFVIKRDNGARQFFRH